MNGLEGDELSAKTSELAVDSLKVQCRDKVIAAINRINLDNAVMEVDSTEFVSIGHTLERGDEEDDYDPFASVSGPHSTCPCSVHSQPSASDDEDRPTRPTDQIEDIEGTNGSSVLLSANTLSLVKEGTAIFDIRERSLGGSTQNRSLGGSTQNRSLGGSTQNNVNLEQTNGVKLYAEDKGPKLYDVKGKIVTPPIIAKNLPDVFKSLPVFGSPKNSAELEEFQNAKVREFVGCALTDEEFGTLADFCSPNHLKTNQELTMSSRFPTSEQLSGLANAVHISDAAESLCIVKKLKMRMNKDDRRLFHRKLKYRGVKMLPLPQNEDYKISFSPLEPGKDLVLRVRVYRPFLCSSKSRHHNRHSVFSHDIVLLGRQKLTALRDRLICPNDVGMRIDVSANPDDQPNTNAKDLFPSGFLFINNIFYVDTREGCKDHSEPIRKWARDRRLGDFPHHDMTQVSLDQLIIKLGHPEVYVHQGNCEHLFTFSELRLLNASDPLRQSLYPHHTAISQNQITYCTSCAEFGAKWIVTGCEKVPFDPAFFCEACFKMYLYQDGKKVCDFKAYSFRGNEINLLKPV